MFAVAHRPIPAAIDEFVVYIGGDVPVLRLPRCRAPTTWRSRWRRKLGDRSAALWPTTAWSCVGKSVDDALHSALVVEHNAQIMWGAAVLGGVVDLPDKARDNFTGVYGFIREQMWGRSN